MLKILPPESSSFHDFKCGEVFCVSTQNYDVRCCLCGTRLPFVKFTEHFDQLHLQINNENHSTEIKDDSSDEDRPFGVDLQDVNRPSLEETSAAETTVGKTIAAVGDEPWSECSSDSDYDWDLVTSCEEDKKELDKLPDKFRKVAPDAMPFACALCDRRYKHNVHLQHHLKYHRNKEMQVNQTQKCDVCGEVFTSSVKLYAHKQKHLNIKCDICSKPFSQLNAMRLHRQRHTGIKSHKCHECDAAFFTDRELKSHALRHTGLWPHICEICGRRCRDRGFLTAHMRRHTGERPATCTVCDKSFYSYHDLNVHAASHSDVRQFVCDICGSMFRLKKALRVHKKIHSGERNYKCPVCDKAFLQSNHLGTHMRSHNTKRRNEKKAIVDVTVIDESSEADDASANNADADEWNETNTLLVEMK